MPLTLLVAAVGALMAGPLLYVATRVRPEARALLDGFVVVATGGLLLLHVVPRVLDEAGVLAFLVLLLGLTAPTLAERWLARAASRVHVAALMLALAGLCVHAAMDGVILTPAGGRAESGDTFVALGLAVVLHRFPVGLTIWLLVRPAFGPVKAVAVIAALIGATVVGFAVGQPLLSGVSNLGYLYFEALVAGSLLHVLMHHHTDTRGGASRWRWESGLGALLAVGFLVLISAAEHGAAEIHAHGEHEGGLFFALLRESAPALVLAYLGAGILGAFMPAATVRWMRRGGSLVQAMRGVAFGLPLPVCSCGVVPLYLNLIRKGTPVAAAMAFFVATPELGIDAVLISLPLLGGELTVARLVAALLVALLVGWLVGLFTQKFGKQLPVTDGDEEKAPKGLKAKAVAVFREGFGETFETTAPWILVGLALAAVAAPILDASGFRSLPAGLDVPLFALIGLPVYVCATGATPLAAALILGGVSPGAALAFLLTGPATNVTTFGVLSDLHGRKVALTFGAAVATLAIGLGLVLNAVLPADLFIPVAEHHEETLGVVEWLSLGILGLVLALTLLRLGPRGFLAPLPFVGHDEEACDECHGEHVGHDDHGDHGDHTHAEEGSSCGGGTPCGCGHD